MDRLKYIIGQLGLFSILKKMFGPLLKRNKLRFFEKGKDNILEELSIITANGARFFLVFGTFLGASRSGEIINGDDDFDIGVFLDDYPRLHQDLTAFGYKVKLSINRDGDIPVLVKYIKIKVVVDIFIHFPEGENIICFDHVNISRKKSLYNEFKDYGYINLYENCFSFFTLTKVNLEGKEFLCPKETTYLQEAYGLDFITPNINWTYTDRNIRKKSEVKGYISNEKQS